MPLGVALAARPTGCAAAQADQALRDFEQGHAQGDGVRLFFVRAGGGPLMLFLHGAPDSSALYDAQLREFCGDHLGITGITVHSIDFHPCSGRIKCTVITSILRAVPDGGYRVAAGRGASARPADGPDLAAGRAAAEERVAAVRLETGHRDARRHVDLLEELA